MHSGGGLEPEDAVRGAPQTLRRLTVQEDPRRRPVARASGERDGGLGRRVDFHPRTEGTPGDLETEARARRALRNALRPLEQAVPQLAEHLRRREVRTRPCGVAEDDHDQHERTRGGRRQGQRASRAQRATRHASEEEARERDPHEGEHTVHARRGERQVELLIAFHRPAPAEPDRLPAPTRDPGAGRDDRIRIEPVGVVAVRVGEAESPERLGLSGVTESLTRRFLAPLELQHHRLAAYVRLRRGSSLLRTAGDRGRSRRGRRRRKLRMQTDPDLIGRETEGDHHERDECAQAGELRVTQRATFRQRANQRIAREHGEPEPARRRRLRIRERERHQRDEPPAPAPQTTDR